VRPLLILVVAVCWLGAALLFSIAVAPAAFAVLPTRALAGALVGRVLPAIFVSGLVGAGVSVVLIVTRPRTAGMPLRLALACAWAAACGIAQWGVMPRIERVRAAIAAPIESLGADDPRRLTFGRLHGVSVALLAAGMLAALVLASLSGILARQRG